MSYLIKHIFTMYIELIHRFPINNTMGKEYIICSLSLSINECDLFFLDYNSDTLVNIYNNTIKCILLINDVYKNVVGFVMMLIENCMYS